MKCRLHSNSIALPFKVNRVMHCFAFLIQVFDKAHDSLWFLKNNPFLFRLSLILKQNGKFRIQVRSLMQPAFDFRRRKPGFLKNLRVRKKIHQSSCCLGSSQLWQKSILQFYCWIPSLIMVMMYISSCADFNIQIRGQCIYYRRPHSMKTSAGLIYRIIKLSTCMQGGENQAFCGDTLFMHSHRDSPSIILNGCGTVLFQSYPDILTEASQMFIHCIIHNFINQMIQSFA